MASIRRRGVKWQVQVRREECPTISKTFNLKSDAERWARSIEQAIDRGELLATHMDTHITETLRDVLIRYRQQVTPKKRGAKIETFKINALLRHSMCDLKLKHLSPALIAQYREERLKVVQSQTVRHELSILSHALKVAINEWGVSLMSNPLDKVMRPSPSKQRTRRVSKTELEALMTAATSCRNIFVQHAIQFAVQTAMRRGEILGLRWDHIDLDNSLLFIPETKNGHPREIPLTLDAKTILLDLGPKPSGHVFKTSANALRLSWVRLRKRANLEDLRFHDLRHEAISRFFEMGLSLPEVALISGHREPRMLMRYTHLKASNIVAKLNSIN